MFFHYLLTPSKSNRISSIIYPLTTDHLQKSRRYKMVPRLILGVSQRSLTIIDPCGTSVFMKGDNNILHLTSFTVLEWSGCLIVNI